MALTKIPGNLIETGAITAAALDNDAVTTAKILDANITHAKLHATMDLTGKTVTVATAAGSTNTTAAASTAFVQQELTTLIGGAPGTLDTLNELAAAINDDDDYHTTLTTALATKLPLAGGTMTGNLIGTQAFFSPNTAGKNTITITTNAVDDGRIIIKSDTTDKVDIQANGTTYFNGGNVGIGTGSPNEKLEVAGSIRLANMKLQNVSSGRIGLNRNTATGAIYDSGVSAFQINGPFTGSDYLDFQSYNSAGTYIDSMVIKAGNVGIGTTSPGVTLDISTSTANTNGVVRIQNNMDNDYEALRIHSLGNFDAQISFLAQGTSTYWGAIGIDYSDAGKFKLQTDNLFVGGSNLMTWARDGKVGIGTTSPSALLHLKSTANSVGPSLIFENTNNAQSMNIDYWNNGGAVQSRIAYAEGPAAWDFIPNVSSDSALHIAYNGQVWAGAVTTGNVATHGVIASSAGQGNLGTTLGDTRRAFAVHGLSQNSDYLTFRNTRITNGQSGWNHSSWEITRDVDNTSKVYNYVSFGIGTTVFNEDGGDLDFRVESDEKPHMLFVSAGSNQVIINDDSSNSCHDTFHVKQLDDRHGMGMVSHGAVAATGPAEFVEGVISMSTVSAGNKISIPITTQSNLWRRATMEIMVQSSEYNQTVGNRGGTAAFTFGMLSYVNGIQQLRRDGNISSITASGANIEINFTTGFTGGLSNYEGCMLYYKILSDQPDYVQVWNAALN